MVVYLVHSVMAQETLASGVLTASVECVVILYLSVMALGCFLYALSLVVGLLGKEVVGSALQPQEHPTKVNLNFLAMGDLQDVWASGKSPVAVVVVVAGAAADSVAD